MVWLPDPLNPLVGLGQDDEGAYAVTRDVRSHALIVGTTGSGKFSCQFAHTVAACKHASLIYIDPKDAAGAIRGAIPRSRVGPVHILDPFDLCKGYRKAAFNPLDRLAPSNPDAISEARQLAAAICVPSGTGGSAKCFDSSARNALVPILLHVAGAPSEKGRSTLKRVRQLLLEVAAELMGGDERPLVRRIIAEDAYGGIVAEQLTSLLSMNERTLGDVIASITQHMGLLDIPAYDGVLNRTTFRFEDLAHQVGTVFITCGARHMEDATSWLRLLTTSAINRIMAANGTVPVILMIDEATTLGQLAPIKVALDMGRSAGIFVNAACQSLAQLEDVWGRAGYQALMSGFGSKILLGCGDMFTAQAISELLGQQTIRTKSESTNRGTRSGSQGETESWIGRPLLTPAEVMSFDRQQLLWLRTGGDPAKLWKFHYFENKALLAQMTPELQRDAPIWVRPTLAPTHRRIGGAKP